MGLTKKSAVNWGWHNARMQKLELTTRLLRTKHHFSPDTIRAWDRGVPARVHSMDRLAKILDVGRDDGRKAACRRSDGVPKRSARHQALIRQ